MVPTGTLSTMSSPSRPLLLLPSPWRPRSALYSGLKRKCTSVLWRSLDSMYTSPPRPPSPPEGPPRGTNFSRRKATHPLPPSPAFTRIRASSMNMGERKRPRSREARTAEGGCATRSCLIQIFGLDSDVLAQAAAVFEADNAADFGEQGVVFAAADVQAGLNAGAALAHDDGAARHQLASEGFYAQPLRVAVAPVAR